MAKNKPRRFVSIIAKKEERNVNPEYGETFSGRERKVYDIKHEKRSGHFVADATEVDTGRRGGKYVGAMARWFYGREIDLDKSSHKPIRIM